MISWWNRHFLTIEGGLMFLSSIALAIWVFYYGGAELFDKYRANNISALSALLSLFGTMAGFILAVIVFLFALIDKNAFAILRASHSYSALWSIFSSALNACAAAALASLCGLVAAWIEMLSPWLLVAIFATTLWSVGRLARVVWVIGEMIRAEVRIGADLRSKGASSVN